MNVVRVGLMALVFMFTQMATQSVNPNPIREIDHRGAGGAAGHAGGHGRRHGRGIFRGSRPGGTDKTQNQRNAASSTFGHCSFLLILLLASSNVLHLFYA